MTDPRSRPLPGSWPGGNAGPPVPAPPGPGPVPAPEAAQDGVAGTGDLRVDAALARLDRFDELPVAEHVAEYDAVHRALQDALTAIDES